MPSSLTLTSYSYRYSIKFIFGILCNYTILNLFISSKHGNFQLFREPDHCVLPISLVTNRY